MSSRNCTMSPLNRWIAALAAMVLLLAASGCQVTGQVEQGRVIAFDKKAELVTLIPEARLAQSAAGILPPVTVKLPEDPEEKGPAPAAGKLMSVDPKSRRLVVFDAALNGFRTIEYTPVSEQRNVKKTPAAPAVDRAHKTITVYSPEQHALITFPASEEQLAMPDDTWRSGDVVRYYYKDPDQAMRFMNVTKTDLSKSGG
jgi:hypothetical protein